MSARRNQAVSDFSVQQPSIREGLPHPAEQSLILSPDTSLIERAFQALIDICKESIPSSNDCTTRNTKSALSLPCQNHLDHAGYYLFVGLAQQQN
ncbi:ANM_HP_G0165630.mRNA.1.CDS.1 [Saccharomyces cerevisiae]|nr:ANM_HP_G0165630.mRNA.1.CDS.1 [Saccharomyces cerevisiae]CAI6920240.1 ANM_HP_G0165630.mRNA.1.CDS.1 [Saccharomyces cerevisiae]